MHYRTLSLETVVAATAATTSTTTAAGRASSDTRRGSPGGHVAVPFPWGEGRGQRGPSTAQGRWPTPLKLVSSIQNPPQSPCILPWWTPDSRVFWFKKKKKKVVGFSRLFKRYSKDRLTEQERRATGLLMGVWVCSALQEFNSTLEEGNVFVEKP